MARLDRLGAVKEIAQVGATLGREFNYDLLYAVSSSERGNTARRAPTDSGSRAGLSEWHPTPSSLSLQTCAHPGHGLSIVAE